jgi:Fe-S cluster assembly iron-binding protein IscA
MTSSAYGSEGKYRPIAVELAIESNNESITVIIERISFVVMHNNTIDFTTLSLPNSNRIWWLFQ